jgi:putative endonuclease
MDSSIRSKSVAIGRLGEAIAEQALLTKGYKVIDRNWRGPEGELDLVVRDEGYLVFVEVKARRSTKFGTPEESVLPHKQRRIANTALTYLLETAQQDKPWRIDIMAIVLSPSDKVIRLTHYVGIEIK